MFFFFDELTTIFSVVFSGASYAIGPKKFCDNIFRYVDARRLTTEPNQPGNEA